MLVHRPAKAIDPSIFRLIVKSFYGATSDEGDSLRQWLVHSFAAQDLVDCDVVISGFSREESASLREGDESNYLSTHSKLFCPAHTLDPVLNYFCTHLETSMTDMFLIS